MAQVLSHPFFFFAASSTNAGPSPPPLPATPPRRKHVFISHFQMEGAGTAHALYHAFRGLGARAWVDMFEEDLTEQGMKTGVEQSDVFLLVLTSNVLTRPYCRKELTWALDLNKPIFLLREEESMSMPRPSPGTDR